MPVEQAIWRIAEQPIRLQPASLESEQQLEDLILKDISILDENWLLIGRQVATGYNSYIDLLALDAAGTVVVIELKKGKTPREVVAQAIDYAAWVETLESDELAEIFKKFSIKYLGGEQSLNDAVRNKFGNSISDEDLNQSHQIVVVGAELDSSSERIVKYLNDKDIPVNVLFFRVFQDASTQYLSRAWLIDPGETQDIVAASSRDREPWNGEYYVSFGHGQGRDWEEAMKYGFISAGGGKWYTQTLNKLHEGDRIWVNIPHTGYVGVGIVEDTPRRYTEFTIQTEGGPTLFKTLSHNAHYHVEYADDDDKTEYFVSVKWLKTKPVTKAVSEIGFFGNQNTVCQPHTPKWRHTVGRLKSLWRIT